MSANARCWCRKSDPGHGHRIHHLLSRRARRPARRDGRNPSPRLLSTPLDQPHARLSTAKSSPRKGSPAISPSSCICVSTNFAGRRRCQPSIACAIGWARTSHCFCSRMKPNCRHPDKPGLSATACHTPQQCWRHRAVWHSVLTCSNRDGAPCRSITSTS